jgi:hypothetical protein
MPNDPAERRSEISISAFTDYSAAPGFRLELAAVSNGREDGWVI